MKVLGVGIHTQSPTTHHERPCPSEKPPPLYNGFVRTAPPFPHKDKGKESRLPIGFREKAPLPGAFSLESVLRSAARRMTAMEDSLFASTSAAAAPSGR